LKSLIKSFRMPRHLPVKMRLELLARFLWLFLEVFDVWGRGQHPPRFLKGTSSDLSRVIEVIEVSSICTRRCLSSPSSPSPPFSFLFLCRLLSHLSCLAKFWFTKSSTQRHSAAVFLDSIART